MHSVNGLSVTACADLCLGRFSCKSFTHKESNGKCQLYAKIYKTPSFHRDHGSKTLYRLTPCIPECPTSGDIMDRYTRAAGFRTVTEPTPGDLHFEYPAVDPISGVYEGGYRPRDAGSFTQWCTTAACSTLAGCAQACFDASAILPGQCRSFNFKSDGTQCKFYRKAYVPNFLAEHAGKQYYHLTVNSNCLPAR